LANKNRDAAKTQERSDGVLRERSERWAGQTGTLGLLNEVNNKTS
jgi:hypothetical protein